VQVILGKVISYARQIRMMQRSENLRLALKLRLNPFEVSCPVMGSAAALNGYVAIETGSLA
jgi:hypothetical protein